MPKSYIPLVSIIVIDYKKENPYLIECLDAIQKETYRNFEIILESDHPLTLNYPKLKIHHFSGKYTPPAKKRDHGAEISKGEIVAFIDDDAHPSPKWLEHLVSDFEDDKIVAIGGPGITPAGVSWLEQASGWASASPVGAGPYTYRFLPGKKRFVDDYPSMNLAVRKKDFLDVGGYDSNYWPGEDTKLCLDLVNKTNKKILYDPKVVVFHHRRPLWKGHLKQNGSFGLHRGFFARILPQTSMRPVYFLPSLMTIGLLFIVLSTPVVQLARLRQIGIALFSLYLLILFVNSIWIFLRSRSLLQSLISIPAIFITHIWYGIRFIQGFLFTTKLTR